MTKISLGLTTNSYLSKGELLKKANVKEGTIGVKENKSFVVYTDWFSRVFNSTNVRRGKEYFHELKKEQMTWPMHMVNKKLVKEFYETHEIKPRPISKEEVKLKNNLYLHKKNATSLLRDIFIAQKTQVVAPDGSRSCSTMWR